MWWLVAGELHVYKSSRAAGALLAVGERGKSLYLQMCLEKRRFSQGGGKGIFCLMEGVSDLGSCKM